MQFADFSAPAFEQIIDEAARMRYRSNGAWGVAGAETGKGGLIGHEKEVTVGTVAGNDYVVLGGLAAGDQVIVSGIQKIGDGMPVRAVAPVAAGGK